MCASFAVDILMHVGPLYRTYLHKYTHQKVPLDENYPDDLINFSLAKISRVRHYPGFISAVSTF